MLTLTLTIMLLILTVTVSGNPKPMVPAHYSQGPLFGLGVRITYVLE